LNIKAPIGYPEIIEYTEGVCLLMIWLKPLKENKKLREKTNDMV